MGSIRDLAISTGPRFDSTWAGQNLDVRYTSHKDSVPCRLQDKRRDGHTKGDPLYRSEETTVMVQEDQAEEPWSLYVGLYTVVEGFKAPPERK